MTTSATLTILQQGAMYTFQWQQTRRGDAPVTLLLTQSASPSLQQRIDHTITLLNTLLAQRTLSTSPPSTVATAADADPLYALGRLLFQQLFPPTLQMAIQELPPESRLIILTNVGTIPWEIAHDGHTYLALTHTISRHLLSSTRPRRAQRTRDGRWSALLIGNPTADLPHTATEIEEIAGLIEAMPGGAPPRILMQRRATKATVLQELATGGYELIHYAGHTRFGVDDEAASGLLLAKGELLTPQELQQSLAGCPFVFLNGCESARSTISATTGAHAPAQPDRVHAPAQPDSAHAPAQPDRVHAPAQPDRVHQDSTYGPAAAFLLGGARGLLGTHWPIYDPSSQRFATAFYRALLEGMSIDRAVQEARVQLQRAHPTDPLWAAFTLYTTPGEPLVLTPQRVARPGTVLAVNFDPLSARFAAEHGETVSRQIDLLHEQTTAVVTRFGGRMPPPSGAHLLAFFPPTSAQNDAERAGWAAQELSALTENSTVALPIEGLGISSGELHWVDAPESQTRSSAPATTLPPLLGAPLQRALALARLAEGGTILVDQAVQQLVQSRFRFTAVTADVDVQGEEPHRKNPIYKNPVYRLLPTAVPPQPFHSGQEARVRFVGRERELALLQEIWQRCHAAQGGQAQVGGQGQLVGIVGEAGIGKSRLVQAFVDSVGGGSNQSRSFDLTQTSASNTAQRIVDKESHLIRVVCPSTYRAGPYEVVMQLLRNLLQLHHQPITMATLTERLQGVVPDAHLAEVLALLALLFDLPEPETSIAHLELQARQRRLVTLLGSLLARQAQQTPLILLLDDLHWADESSMEILTQWVVGIERLPVLLIALFRAEQAWQPPWWHRRNYQQIHLDALDAEAGSALLNALLEADTIPASLQKPLLARSGGNPLFVQELVAALTEGGTLGQGTLPEQMPGTIQRVLLSRLDALPATARRVLDAAAVIGDTVDQALLRAAIQPNVEQPALDAALAELESRNFLYQAWQEDWATPGWLAPWADDRTPAGERDEPTLHFHHALVREVAYSTMRVEERCRTHRRLGERLAQTDQEDGEEERNIERLAHHFYYSVVTPTVDGSMRVDAHAEPPFVRRAIHYLQQAGIRAQTKYAGRNAIRHYRQALTLAGALSQEGSDNATVVHLFDGLGAAHQLVSELDEAIAALENAYAHQQALAPPAANADKAAMARRIGRLYEWKSDYPTALSWMESGLALVTPPSSATEASIAAALHVRVGCVRYSQGDHSAATTQCEAGLALATTQQAAPVRAEAHNLLGSIHDLQGATARASQHYQESLAIYRALDNPYEVARVENNLGLVFFRSGEWTAAKAHLQRGIAFWEEIEDQYNLAFNRLNLGVIEMYQGGWAVAEQNFRGALALWGEANNQRWCALCHTNLGLLSIEQARWAEARHHLEESRALLTQQAIRHFLPEVTYALAEVALGQGDPQGALAQAEEAVALARTLEMKLEEGIGLRIMGRAHGALGAWSTAGEQLQQSLTLLRALGNQYEVARTLVVLAEVVAQTTPTADRTIYLDEANRIFQKLDIVQQ